MDKRLIMKDNEKKVRILVAADPQIQAVYQQALCPESDDPKNETVLLYDLVFHSLGGEAVDAVKAGLSENQPFAAAFLDISGMDAIAAGIRAADPHIQLVMVPPDPDNFIQDIDQTGLPHQCLFIQKPLSLRQISNAAAVLASKWMTEKDLRGAEAALRENRESLNAAAPEKSDGTIVITDINGVIQLVDDQKLYQLATLDGLTRAANRRRFDEYFAQEWRRLKRESLPISLLVCDIDFFKLYNESYGHQAGDDCLRQTAQAISRTVHRPADLVARYGSDEFAVLLPNTNHSGALHIAQAIWEALGVLKIPHQTSPLGGCVTLSIGAACIVPTPDWSPAMFIEIADNALYQAKLSGRNRIVMQ
jgi:diguanylate cyclase (GGDEF)-like protein